VRRSTHGGCESRGRDQRAFRAGLRPWSSRRLEQPHHVHAGCASGPPCGAQRGRKPERARVSPDAERACSNGWVERERWDFVFHAENLSRSRRAILLRYPRLCPGYDPA
jgi:hypothetical protein